MDKTSIGVYSIDITPEVGVELDGYHRESPSIGIKDRLLASTMIIDNKINKFVLISIDSIGITVIFATIIRREVCKLLNIKIENVMVCYTHTHSSPKTLNERNELNQYSKYMLSRIIECTKRASFKYKYCKIGWSYAECEIGSNRREKTKDNKAIMGENPSGVIDKRIGILKIVDAHTGKIDTILLRVSAHGNTLKGDNLLISADYFSNIRLLIKEKYNCKVIIINGAAGNINARFRGSDLALKKMAAEVLKSIGKVIGSIEVCEIKCISMKSDFIETNTIEIPDKIKAEELSKIVAKNWDVDTTNWLSKINALIDANKKSISITYELQKFQLNDGMFLGCPMEIFSETSLEVSNKLKNKMIFLNGYTNGYYMYLPSEEEFYYGGYEVDWCPVVYGPMFGILMPFNINTEKELISRSIKLALSE